MLPIIFSQFVFKNAFKNAFVLSIDGILEQMKKSGKKTRKKVWKGGVPVFIVQEKQSTKGGSLEETLMYNC